MTFIARLSVVITEVSNPVRIVQTIHLEILITAQPTVKLIQLKYGLRNRSDLWS